MTMKNEKSVPDVLAGTEMERTNQTTTTILTNADSPCNKEFLPEEENLKLINMADIAAEKVEWLFYPFIPLKKLTILHSFLRKTSGSHGKTSGNTSPSRTLPVKKQAKKNTKSATASWNGISMWTLERRHYWMNLNETFRQKKEDGQNQKLEEARKTIQKMEGKISALSSENSELRKKLQEKSGRIVSLQNSDKELKKAKELKKEAESLRSEADKQRTEAWRMMDSASEKEKRAVDRQFRLFQKESELEREKRSIPYRIEAGIEENANAIYQRTAGKLFPPVLLTGYSILVTTSLLQV